MHLYQFIFFIILLVISSTAKADLSLPDKLNLFKNHYPQHIKQINGNTLTLSNGQALKIDDGKAKTHQQKLKNADIEDMLSQIYPVGRCNDGQRSRNQDPGRIRNETFMRTVYGNSSSQVSKNLVRVDWFGKRLSFTKTNGAANALIKVRDEFRNYPHLRKYVAPSAGTFNWRTIAGTRRLSVHSFAAAIDINLKYSHYWRNYRTKGNKFKPYKNQIPVKVIEIFEKHGFIWGGKWYHYDTMHFEYRPALIAIGKHYRGKC